MTSTSVHQLIIWRDSSIKWDCQPRSSKAINLGRFCKPVGKTTLVLITNHLWGPHHNEGHYSVLARINRNTIHLHDPSLGPSVAYSKEEFLALWLPTSSQSEIAGNVLVAITNSDYEPSIWAHCNQCIPKSMACRNCGNELPLQPVRALGCVQPTCVQRLWYRLFCPQCDAAHECISG